VWGFCNLFASVFGDLLVEKIPPGVAEFALSARCDLAAFCLRLLTLITGLIPDSIGLRIGGHDAERHLPLLRSKLERIRAGAKIVISRPTPCAPHHWNTFRQCNYCPGALQALYRV